MSLAGGVVHRCYLIVTPTRIVEIEHAKSEMLEAGWPNRQCRRNTGSNSWVQTLWVSYTDIVPKVPGCTAVLNPHQPEEWSGTARHLRGR
jgi:hypothetical protein